MSLALPAFRWVWAHQSRIGVAAATVAFVAGLLVPNQRLFGSVLVNFSRAAVVVALLLWVLLQLVRKRRPGLKLVDVISQHTDRPRYSAVERIVVGTLFAGVAFFYSSIGAMLGGVAGLGVGVFLRAAQA
ncbi:hypothetical protein [Ramlibacter alkalitolerans]|uniref:Uncharacterized protein n=1 Tax=Ramlibacter alkalitolerans TaxID=2039631 RepID=A0ABS1JR48_9BURK|nr:hypothetical protein [Ramlibacter alkalitolerans]MBL0426718.1 hypothetical protein [Ramlibacter alkalitolerans]